MAPKPETIQKLMHKRVDTACKTHRVAEAHFDPDSGAGVIVAQNNDSKLVALFFDPAATNRFQEVEISAHQRISLGSMLKERVAADKARKNQPHDLKVGDIFVYSYGATIRRVTFYRVTGIPHPQKISAVTIPSKVTYGTIDTGTVVPDLDAPPLPSAKEEIFPITMEGGSASLKTPQGGWKLERGYLWDGEPQHNMQD